MWKNVTEAYNNSPSFNSLTVKERNHFKLKLEAYLADLNTLNDKLLPLLQAEWDTEEEENLLEDEVGTCECYQDKIYSCLTKLNHLSLPLPTVQPPSVPQFFSSILHSTLSKCLMAPLPQYWGKDYEDFSKFFNDFESTISK